MTRGKRKEPAATPESPESGFEAALARLEEIVGELEGGDLPLERALELFEEGTRLGRLCGRKLDEAERRITVLLEAASGELVEEDFEPGRGPDAEPPAARAPRRKSAAPPAPLPAVAKADDVDDDLPF